MMAYRFRRESVGASLAIGGLYLLLKVGIDITSLYAVMVTLFGALSISGE